MEPNDAEDFHDEYIDGAKLEGDLLLLHPNQRLSLRLISLHSDLINLVLNGVLPMWRHSGLCIHDQQLWIQHTQTIRTS